VFGSAQRGGPALGLPVAALRYFTSQIKGRKAPKDIELSTSPPDLRFAATLDVMGTPVRASTSVKIDDVTIQPDSVRIGIRLSGMKLDLLQDDNSPVATSSSRARSILSKPANLVSFAPKRPEALVEAEGDRIVLELMKVPKLASSTAFRKALAIAAPWWACARWRQTPITSTSPCAPPERPPAGDHAIRNGA